jgi:PAS domain S-box-containing protein
MESMRILIVDDDVLTALALQMVVTSMGHECLDICRDSESAIAAAAKIRPDIALVDINIEGQIDGVDTAEILYSRYNVHVLFITAYSDEATLLRVKSSHPFGYILKPYTDQNVRVALTIALYQIDLERTLREKDELLKAALSVTKVGIWRYNDGKRAIYLNASASSMLNLGKSEIQIETDKIELLIHPDDLPFFIRKYERAMNEKGQFELDIRIASRKNEYRWLRTRGVSSMEAETGNVYMTGSIVDITDRKILEDKFINIYESNRQEMGQEIHDELGQQLTGLTLLTESLVASLEQKNMTEEADRAKKIADRAYAALEDVRRIARNLYPVQITPQGFEDAILALAADAEALAGIPCVVENRAGPIYFNNAQATQIFYIIREAINNSIKHSQATQIRIRIHREEDSIVIIVADNGVGIQEDTPKKGLGLNIMEFRAGRSKGTLRVLKGETGGSEVVITVKESPKKRKPALQDTDSSLAGNL